MEYCKISYVIFSRVTLILWWWHFRLILYKPRVKYHSFYNMFSSYYIIENSEKVKHTKRRTIRLVSVVIQTTFWLSWHVYLCTIFGLNLRTGQHSSTIYPSLDKGVITYFIMPLCPFSPIKSDSPRSLS